MPIKLLQNVLRPEIDDPGLTYDDVKNHKYFNLYVISCFFYAISGLIRIRQGAKQDGINLIIQSLLSFMSDVYTIGKTSYWHIIDRYYALSISIYHFYSLKTKRALILNSLLCLIGFRYLTISQHYHAKRSDKNLLAHAKWHSVAPMMALLSDI